MRNIFWALIAAALVVATPAAGRSTRAFPPTGLPTASMFSSTLLPEMQGVVSWKTLSQVEPIKQGDKMVPKFSDEILGLDTRPSGFRDSFCRSTWETSNITSCCPPSRRTARSACPPDPTRSSRSSRRRRSPTDSSRSS